MRSGGRGGRGDRKAAFTILEILVVLAIILVLAGLVLATSSYVHNKGARSRAEAEIAAMSAALENYKADNGVYPTNVDTELLDPVADFNPTEPLPNKYSKAALYLYKQLSGDTNGDRDASEGRVYLSFKPAMLLPVPPSTATVEGIRDPFGNCYGYSTARAANPSGTAGFNPTFDLWSTADYLPPTGPSPTPTPSPPPQTFWIKNW